MDYLDNVAFVVLRLQESAQPDKAHEAFQAVLREVERLRKSEAAAWEQYDNMAENSQEYADEAKRLRDALKEIHAAEMVGLPFEKWVDHVVAGTEDVPRACEVQDLDRAGNYCTVHGWHPTLECFESERRGIARDTLVEEK